MHANEPTEPTDRLTALRCALLRAAGGAHVFVIVDTNVLLSHLSSTERTLERLVGAALDARCARDAPFCPLSPSCSSLLQHATRRVLPS